MITVNNLTKVFRTDEVETIALDSATFEIKEGEFVAIMGPSGCGKSTLMNILGLLDNPTEGSYTLFGQEMANLKEKERTQFRKGNIGFVFQSFNLIDELPLTYLKVSAAERKERVEEIMRRMSISHRAKHYPQQLSGGQQQRVAIARAVVANAKLILADEPTGNLDSTNGREVMQLLGELNEAGTTIVMVTHSPKDAAKAQRIINLFDGKIVRREKSTLNNNQRLTVSEFFWNENFRKLNKNLSKISTWIGKEIIDNLNKILGNFCLEKNSRRKAAAKKGLLLINV